MLFGWDYMSGAVCGGGGTCSFLLTLLGSGTCSRAHAARVWQQQVSGWFQAAGMRLLMCCNGVVAAAAVPGVHVCLR